jgi:hypothetical protein
MTMNTGAEYATTQPPTRGRKPARVCHSLKRLGRARLTSALDAAKVAIRLRKQKRAA